MKKRTKSMAIILVVLLLMQSIGIAPVQTQVVYADMQIDTQPPTAPTNLTSTGITATTVNLAWDASTDDVGVTEYNVFNGAAVIGTTTTTSCAITNLSPNTQYNLTVKAKDAAGNISVASAELVVTTDIAADNQSPSVPTTLTAISITSTSAAISWSPSTDNVSVVGYDVYIGETMAGTVAGTTYSAINLTPNTAYNFSVRAKDAAGNISAASESLAVTTELPSDSEAPSAPANLAVSSKTQTSISLAWSESSDNEGVTEYKVLRNNLQIGTASTTSFDDINLTPNTTYTYTVKASDVAGNISQDSTQLNVTTDALPDTQAPTAPTNLQAASKTNSSVSLIWNASTDDVGIDKYEVFCNNDSVGFSTAASYTCSGLNQGTTYSFYIKAYDAAGNISDPSAAFNVTTDDTQAPAAPANLRLVNRTGTTISLAWDASTDNIGVTGYEIYNNTNLTGTTAGDTTLSVTGLAEGTSHTFTVKAKDAAGNFSEASNSLNASTLPAIPGVPSNIITTPAATSITVSWDAVPSATSYDIEFDGVVKEDITTSSYIFSGLTPNTSHTIRLLSKNEGGSSTWSSPINVWTLLQTPTNFVVTQLKNTLTSTWNTVANANGYDIEVDGVVIDNGASTTYVNSGLTTGSSHTYRVRAKNSNTISDWTVLITQSVIDYTAISGTISQDITLTLSNSPYLVTGNLTVAPNVTMTVMPGVVLKFNPGIGITVYGKVSAIGDEQNKIIFTTSKDPLYGGTGVSSSSDYWKAVSVETGGELNGHYLSVKYGSCTASANYSSSVAWSIHAVGNINLYKSEILNSNGYGILLRGYSNATIDSCQISNSESHGIYSLRNYSSNSTVTIRNCNITNNKARGIHIEDNSNIEYNILNNTISNNLDSGIYINIVGQNKLLVSNNIISSNSKTGIYVYQYNGGILGTIKDNQITNNLSYPIYFVLEYMTNSSIFSTTSGNTYSGNVLNSIAVDAVGIGYWVNSDITLTDNIPVYIVDENGISVKNGKTFTIQPGIIMKFFVKYAASPMIYIDNGIVNALGTSDKPIVFTSIKDTEYGGSGIVDAIWDKWGGIIVKPQGEFNGDYIKVKYGGSNYSASAADAFCVAGKFRLTNSEISDTGVGISYDTNNAQLIPVIAFNTFKRLSYRGVYNNYYEGGISSVIVDASYNYWDSIYGPNDVVKVGSGVNTTPYIGSEFKFQFNFGGDIVNPATGNFARQYTDMAVKSPGFDLSIGRAYNSLDDRQGSLLGRGWTFSLESSIKDYRSKITLQDGTVRNYTLPSEKIVRLPDGSAQSFSVNPNGTFTAKDTRNKLVKQADGTYILTTKDLFSYCFNTDGYIKSASDRNGNTIIYNVDANGRILGVTDQVGRTFTISYNAQGYIETITDTAGRVVTYQYDNNLLARVIDPMGNVSRYVYDSQGFLTEIRNNDTNPLELVTYNHQQGENLNKVGNTTDKNGNVFTYVYDNANSMTVITDSNGRQTIQSYDNSYCVTNSTDPEGKTVITEYFKDANGNNKFWEEKSTTDRNGNKTQYLRDANGNVTQITNPDNSTKVMTYDAQNNLTSLKDENGKFTYYIYDASGKNLIKKVQPLNGTDAYVDGTIDVTQFAITLNTYYTEAECQQLGYTAKGLLKSLTDPEGNIITYTYDQWGNIKTITDQEGKVTTYNYNNIGLKISEVSSKQYTTTYNYDFNGRLEKLL